MITLLRKTLTSHEEDPRYLETLRLQRLAGMYLPFAITMVRIDGVAFRRFTKAEQEEWLSCFIWILK